MAVQYETVIGLEVHVELSTRTKIFCGCSTAFGAPPNTNICPVCTGMPGTLPVLNRQVVDAALAVGLALNAQVNRFCRFDRKNYFYPDNPQNYQISQLYLPICYDGWLEIEADPDAWMADADRKTDTNAESEKRQGQKEKGGRKRIGIHELHMEEDAGKLLHEETGDATLIDYNRSGVPLLEIVSEPDMRSAQEVRSYLEKLRQIIRYLGVSDCRLQEGSMRVDVNLSVRKVGAQAFGTRTEMKNLGSFRAIGRAIAAERERQIAILEAGGAVRQETRRWDEEKDTSFSMRSKEETQDYRYFPEPDLPPVQIGEAWIQTVRDRQPEFQTEKLERYRREFGLSQYDAQLLTESRHAAELFEETAALCGRPKKVANWLTGEAFRLLKEENRDADTLDFAPEHLAALIRLTEEGTITQTVAKTVFEKIFYEDVDPVRYVEAQGLKTVSDDGLLRQAVQESLAENPKSVADYLGGKERALGFLVGQTMKRMKGKADPKRVQELLGELIKQE